MAVVSSYRHDDLGIASPISPIPCFIILLEVGAERKVTVLRVYVPYAKRYDLNNFPEL